MKRSFFPRLNWRQALYCLTAMLMTTLVHAQSSARPEWSQFYTDTMPLLGPSIDGTGRIGGIAADSFRYVYVANQDNSVWRIDPHGDVELFADGFYGSSGLLVLSNGDVLVGECNADRITRLDRSGNKYSFATEGLDCPVGMAKNAKGEVFAINFMAGNVVKIDQSGKVSVFAKHELLDGGNGLTIDRQGNLYAVSLKNTAVAKISPEGKVTKLADLPGNYNAHIAYSSGMLFVTKLWEHVVLGVKPDGSYEVVSGDGVRDSKDGTGVQASLSYPNGIWATGDMLYVNTLDGGMRLGERGTIRVRRIYMPNPRRALLRAASLGGNAELRKAYDMLKSNFSSRESAFIATVNRAAKAFFSQHDHLSAMALHSWLIADHGSNVTALVNAANAQADYGARSKAIALYDRALALKPNHKEAVRRLAGVRALRHD